LEIINVPIADIVLVSAVHAAYLLTLPFLLLVAIKANFGFVEFRIKPRSFVFGLSFVLFNILR
jgi:hypothetical protein